MNDERKSSLRWSGMIVAAAVGSSFLFHVTSLAQTRVPPSNPVAQEVSSVKRVIAARREYQASLETLRASYVANNDNEKLRWAEDELRQFHRVPKHAYVLDLDVPGPGLRAEQNIPQ